MRWRHLGTDALSWRDLKVIVAEAPIDSALTRARNPDAHEAQLRILALLHYQAAVANVQRGNASGASASDFPPVPEFADDTRTRIGSNPIPLDELDAWLGWQH